MGEEAQERIYDDLLDALGEAVDVAAKQCAQAGVDQDEARRMLRDCLSETSPRSGLRAAYGADEDDE